MHIYEYASACWKWFFKQRSTEITNCVTKFWVKYIGLLNLLFSLFSCGMWKPKWYFYLQTKVMGVWGEFLIKVMVLRHFLSYKYGNHLKLISTCNLYLVINRNTVFQNVYPSSRKLKVFKQCVELNWGKTKWTQGHREIMFPWAQFQLR